MPFCIFVSLLPDKEDTQRAGAAVAGNGAAGHGFIDIGKTAVCTDRFPNQSKGFF